MSYHSVNASKSIVWVDGSSNTHNITKVVYCDNNRSPHTIWPCVAELTNVYITELKTGNGSSDVHHAYTLSNPQYTTVNGISVLTGGDPSYCLKPGVDYAITGTIIFYKNPGVIEKIVQGCYFFPETQNLLEPNNTPGIVEDPNISPYGDRLPDDGSGTPIYEHWNTYSVWQASESFGHLSPVSVQVGWYGGNSYVQNGYLFDPNYASPIILKRPDVERFIRVYNNSGDTGNSNVTSQQLTMRPNDSITIWPKYYDCASDSSWGNETWTKYTLADDLTLNDITYNSNNVSVVINNNHSITITALTEGTHTVQFGTSSGLFHSLTISLYVQPEYIYRLEPGGNPVTGTVTTTTAVNVYIKQCADWLDHTQDPENMTWVNYTGTATITSSNNAFTCGNGSENYIKTITPDVSQPNVESTITVTLQNGNTLQFTAKVGVIQNIYAKGQHYDNNSWTQLNAQYPYYVAWNINTYPASYLIYLSTDNAGTNTFTSGYVRQGNYSLSSGTIIVGYNSGTISLTKNFEAANIGANESINIDVYDYEGGTLLGTINVAINK